MSQIITQTPLWVWPLFILLLVVGLRAARQRWAPVLLIYLLPVLGISGVNTVAGLTPPAVVWSSFGMAYALGLLSGYRMQGHLIIEREGARVHLRGEYWTLAVMMLIFGANFVSGVLEAVAPQMRDHVMFQMIFAAALAIGSGSFAGRALRVWRGQV
jgi:hypothetical protein